VTVTGVYKAEGLIGLDESKSLDILDSVNYDTDSSSIMVLCLIAKFEDLTFGIFLVVYFLISR